MGAHSILPPSLAPVFVNCSGVVRLLQSVPEREETEEQREGTAAHDLGAKMIGAGARAGFGSLTREVIGTPASNGVIISEEMYEAAELYARDVIDVMHKNRSYAPIIETPIACPGIHPESWGTPDAWLYARGEARLYVWDYKHGHLPVEAWENWQLINYVSGIFSQLGVNGENDQFITVHLRVIQPRAYHHSEGPVREWVVKGSDLRAHFNTLSGAAHKALSDSAECHAGPHCRYCDARHVCEAAQRYAAGWADYVGRPVPVELPPEALGLELRLLREAKKAIEARHTALEEQAIHFAKAGHRVPFWGVEPKTGRPRWTRPAKEVIALGKLLQKDFSKPDAVVTPTQARDMGLSRELLDAYSETPRTGVKLVYDDGAKARRVFSK